VVEHYLGLSLAKEHSAVDWSTRPLPKPWLDYAALDVEVLVELRAALDAELEAAGKAEWARQEFDHLLGFEQPVRVDAWRRTSGLHKVRGRRALAAVRALWETRDDIARARDLAPGRVLPDSAIIEAVLAQPSSEEELARMPVFRGKATRRYASTWYAALAAALAAPEELLPTPNPPSEGPPATHRWAERDPVAAARLAPARAAVAAAAEEHDIPAQNLLAPETIRRLAWSPPKPVDLEAVAAALRTCGARDWQVRLTAAPLAEALSG